MCAGSAVRPWCQRASRDPVPLWHWPFSWDAAWSSAMARTTPSPSCWKGSVSWCATRILLRTERSLPRLAYRSAPLGQRWLFLPCVGPTTSLQRWATRLWPSTLTRSVVHWINHQQRQSCFADFLKPPVFCVIICNIKSTGAGCLSFNAARNVETRRHLHSVDS